MACVLFSGTGLAVIGCRAAADAYSTGIAIVGSNIAVGSGDVAVDDGSLSLYNRSGTVLWEYNSLNNDYVLGLDAADIDDDGDYEIVIGLHMDDHAAVMVNHLGSQVWSFDNGSGNYVRAIRIGEVSGANSGKEIAIGGRNGTLHLLDKNGSAIWSKTGATSLCNPSCDGGSYTTIQAIEIADTDLDGQSEIIIGYNRYAKKYDSSGTLVWTADIGDSDSMVWGTSAGNVTDNAGLEIAAAVGHITTGSVDAVKLLTKDGAVIWSWTAPSQAWSVKIADINNDGQNEVIVGYGTFIGSGPSLGSGGVAVLNSAGTEIYSIDLPSSVKFLSFGDVNGDGESETIASCDDGYTYIIACTEWTCRILGSSGKTLLSSGKTLIAL